MSRADRLLAAERSLSREVAPLRFGAPVTHVYQPLRYARVPHRAYLRRFAEGRKRVLFVGMNPGPWGMAQTGVPFGDVAMVRDWLGIEGRVERPPDEHPKRPVQGFACPRGEVSGDRLWGAIRAHWGSPERFFRHAFVANYCPLVFLERSGRNRTPDRLPGREREPLFRACDRHLRRVARILETELVVGVGRFAEQRAREALAGAGVRIGGVLHPSPASPAANRGWTRQAARQLRALGACDA
jgi:single-strand selective monofunctional uracil DNA glycosylase